MATDSNTPRLAYSYLRFSREEQGRGSSIQRQESLREKYLARLGLTLCEANKFEDRGISGYYGKNASAHLGEFLALVKSGAIPPNSILILESLDRLSRDEIRSARDRLESILEAGVEIHTLQPERVYDRTSLTDPFALIGLILEFAKAFEHSQQLSRRIGAAWEGKRRKAADSQEPLSRTTPAWLKVADGKYEIIPERAQTIERIYKLCAEDGLGISAIVTTLTRRKVPSFPGGKWTESYVAKILRGEAAVGIHTPYRIDPATKKRIPSEKIKLFPAVVSEALNSRVKVAMRARKNKGVKVRDDQEKVHPLAGLISTHSGASVRIKYRQVSRTGPNQIIPFLREVDTNNSYPLQEFEQIVLGWLTSYEPSPVKQQSSNEVTAVEEKIALLEHKIEDLKAEINSGKEYKSFLELLANAERDKEAQSERLEELRAIQPLEQGFTILWAQLHSLWNSDGLVSGPEFGSVPLIDLDQARAQKREALLEVRATLRRLVKSIELTIGREHKNWRGKSLKVTVTFRDGTLKEFAFRP